MDAEESSMMMAQHSWKRSRVFFTSRL